jgi:hypothetical protein
LSQNEEHSDPEKMEDRFRSAGEWLSMEDTHTLRSQKSDSGWTFFSSADELIRVAGSQKRETAEE